MLLLNFFIKIFVVYLLNISLDEFFSHVNFFFLNDNSEWTEKAIMVLLLKIIITLCDCKYLAAHV